MLSGGSGTIVASREAIAVGSYVAANKSGVGRADPARVHFAYVNAFYSNLHLVASNPVTIRSMRARL